jgi:hypothetical protein
LAGSASSYLTKRPKGDQEDHLMKLRTVAALGAITLGTALTPALASASQPAIGDTSVFATVPFPGHPFGVAVDHGRIYISTSRGDFFASPATGGQLNSAGERVFAYDPAGHLVNTTVIATMPNSDMGLFGLALDGNPTPTHKLYVADMNGRILRLSLDRDASAPKLFAQVPAPFSGLGWHASMWNDLVFDPAGNLYMTDDKPRLCGSPRTGTPRFGSRTPGWRASSALPAARLVAASTRAGNTCTSRSRSPRPIRLNRSCTGSRS